MTESLFHHLRRAFYWPLDRWREWRMRPGAEACGKWIRMVRDDWIAEMWATKDWAETADASAVALDAIYGFMVAHGWMEMDPSTNPMSNGNGTSLLMPRG